MKFKAHNQFNGRVDRDEETIDELEDILKISRMQSRGENVENPSRETKRHGGQTTTLECNWTLSGDAVTQQLYFQFCLSYVKI